MNPNLIHSLDAQIANLIQDEEVNQVIAQHGGRGHSKTAMQGTVTGRWGNEALISNSRHPSKGAIQLYAIVDNKRLTIHSLKVSYWINDRVRGNGTAKVTKVRRHILEELLTHIRDYLILGDRKVFPEKATLFGGVVPDTEKEFQELFGPLDRFLQETSVDIFTVG